VVTTPLLPPDAPFDASQRRFVEGYLAALVAVRAARARAAVTAPAAAGAPLVILYGSQSGNCESIAKSLRKHGRSRGFDPTVSSLDAFDRSTLAEVGHLLIVCSTFGEGDPPDNAKAFHAWLHEDDLPSLSGLSYSVCALGDRSYTQFCKAGRDIDERLAALGATRIAPRVECDVAYEDDLAAWRDAVFSSESMVAVAGSPAAIDVIEDAVDAPTDPAWTRQHPFPATLLRVVRLSGEGSAKEVNHVELSLAGSGLEYDVGDALGVWPTNCGDTVEAIIDAGGLTGEESVCVRGESMPLRMALLTRLDLCVLPPTFAEKLGLSVDCSTRQLIDALQERATDVDPQALVDALRPLQPRLYSIASSPRVHLGQVHLTVGAVRYSMHDRPRAGVASCWFADRLSAGASVPVYVQKSSHFHLPQDPDAPLIMIGPGTGIAPFRAFLEERAEQGARGDTWLFFGDQHESTDFLYRRQLLGFLDAGVLSRLDLAWSRDAAEKVYVQNRMIEHGAEVFRWLERGAYLYVCGDAKRMARDVDAAVRRVIAEHGGLTAEDADRYVERLTTGHRYRRDVY
jgi:sulfite reductase (NADPH) flavoprotein alpha-component